MNLSDLESKKRQGLITRAKVGKLKDLDDRFAQKVMAISEEFMKEETYEGNNIHHGFKKSLDCIGLLEDGEYSSPIEVESTLMVEATMDMETSFLEGIIVLETSLLEGNKGVGNFSSYAKSYGHTSYDYGAYERVNTKYIEHSP
ncbi:hypothetical protein M9H77_30344 [Catharanthus roseus]|uniref:Uncharacterized protein n=1 Tax=Catharanthus roseus TaxID=4058 RepID=A0ACB9ZX03_CATRO|nr:hypothetical protein M9H77_30344 [Catharanthus roseus]